MPDSEIKILVPDVEDLKALGATVLKTANAIVVSDRATHERAQLELRNVAGGDRAIDARLAPTIHNFYSEHRKATTLRNDLLRPWQEARRIIVQKCAVFESQERAKAEAKARRLQEEARQREADRQLAEAIEAAEQAGAAVGDAVLAEARPVPTVVVAPEIAQVDGISKRVQKSAEVYDLAALIRYCGAHPDTGIAVLVPNMTALNSLARNGTLNLPGVRTLEREITSVRA